MWCGVDLHELSHTVSIYRSLCGPSLHCLRRPSPSPSPVATPSAGPVFLPQYSMQRRDGVLEGLDSVRTGRPHPLQCECECVGVSGCGAMSSPFGTRLEPQHSSMMLLRCSVCVEGAVQRGNCFINFPPFPELATSWVLPCRVHHLCCCCRPTRVGGPGEGHSPAESLCWVGGAAGRDSMRWEGHFCSVQCSPC